MYRDYDLDESWVGVKFDADYFNTDGKLLYQGKNAKRLGGLLKIENDSILDTYFLNRHGEKVLYYEEICGKTVLKNKNGAVLLPKDQDELCNRL